MMPNIPTDPSSCLVEIAVDSLQGAKAAIAGGAHRIELCAHLDAGGLTPSQGLLQAVLTHAAGRVPVFAMARPRAGDFCYDEDEFAVLQREVATLRAAGAHGIVTGVLLHDGGIDRDRMRRLCELAAPLPVTFHRAFDLVRDAEASLDVLIELQIARVLTSGQEASAELGQERIRTLRERAGGRIVVMPGAGIRDHNIRSIVDATGVREVHLSARGARPSRMTFGRDVAMGPEDDGGNVRITDPDMVRRAVAALREQ